MKKMRVIMIGLFLLGQVSFATGQEEEEIENPIGEEVHNELQNQEENLVPASNPDQEDEGGPEEFSDLLGVPVMSGQMIADYSGKTLQEIAAARAYFENNLDGSSLSSCHCGFLELWEFPDTGIDIQSRGVEEETDLDNDDIAYNYSIGITSFDGLDLIPVDLEDRGEQTINDRTIVAVIDSGVDGELNEFDNFLWESETNPSNNTLCESNIPFGYNPMAPETPIKDDIGHGTHVSGIIIEDNPSVELMVIKVANGASGNLFDVICGIHFAIERNAEVINLSMTQKGEKNSVFDKAIQKARDANVIVVCSAGNDSEDLEQTNMQYWPGDFDYGNIINVAAIGPDGELCDFSNYGITDVDVAAPGLYIESLVPLDMTNDVKSGTSMATAFVTREVTLLKYENPSMNNQAIIEMLYDSRLETAPGLIDKTAIGKKLSGMVYKTEE